MKQNQKREALGHKKSNKIEENGKRKAHKHSTI